MCGIAGFVRPGGEGREDLLRRMTGTMALRGPDHDGWKLFEGGAGLGHRRLAVLDLTPAADQPLSDESGRVWVVFNGEIYNYRQLRSELADRGHRLAGTGDAEILPHLYEEWGDRFPERLRGMFALALWDVPRRRLLLVRDRLGIKPLAYRLGEQSILFGSTLDPLLADSAVPRLVGRRTLARYLALGCVGAPESILEGVSKLSPGHLLVFENGRAEVRRWWRVPTPQPFTDQEEALDAVQQRLEESVRLHLASDVPLGAFLSGGLDSSLVVAAMARVASRPRTFTVGFREAGFDEAPFARRVAEFLGTEHTERYVDGADALALVGELPEVFDEPFADSSALPMLLVAGTARRSVTVALSGDGGDELFAGYPRYRWFLGARHLLSVPAGVRRLLRPAAERWPGARLANAAGLLDAAGPLELYAGMVGTARGRMAAELTGVSPDLAAAPFGAAFDQAGESWLEKLAGTDLATYLPDDILVKLDRTTMARSLEARVPLLDHLFVETALAVPPAMKYRRGRGKLLLRRLLGRYLPPGLTDRPKQGFAVPLACWLRGELSGLLRETTEPGRVARENFFRPAVLTRLVDEHLARRRNHHHLLWAVLVFQLWRERRNAAPAEEA